MAKAKLKIGDRVKVTRRIWSGKLGFVGIRKAGSVPKGAVGKIVGTMRWEGQNLFRVAFDKHGRWGVLPSELKKT